MSSTAMCPEDVTYEAKGMYTWPETVHYSDAVLECARGVSAVATRSCVLDGEGGAVWEPPNTNRCDMVHTCIYVNRCDMVHTRIYVNRCDMVPTCIYVNRYDMVHTRIYVNRCDMVHTRIYVKLSQAFPLHHYFNT